MENWLRLFIVIGGFIEALIFSGCLFGWGSLVYVLQQEGVYSHLCETNKLNSLQNGLLSSSANSYETTTIRGTTVLVGLNNAPEEGRRRFDDDSFTIFTIDPLILDNNNDNNNIENNQSRYKEQVPFTERQVVLNNNLDDETFDDNDFETSTIIVVADGDSDGDDDQNVDMVDKVKSFSTSSSNHNNKSYPRCIDQDNQFNLIYTIAAANYGLTAIIIGFCLDKFGLWATRTCASIMTTGGFLCLAFTSHEIPWLLWPALNLISLGTIQLRQSSFQFANIFPNSRATILTLYGGGYSISTTLFLLVQYGVKGGIPYTTTILIMTGISILTLPFTFFMPRMKIDDQVTAKGEEDEEIVVDSASIQSKNKYKDDDALVKSNLTFQNELLSIKFDNNDVDDELADENENSVMFKDSHANEQIINMENSTNPTNVIHQIPIPLKESLYSLSALFHIHWHFINFFMILYYSASFNAWAYKTTNDPNEVAFYNEVSGLCQLIAPFFIPIAGCMTDILIKRASKCEDPVEKQAVILESSAYTLIASTTFVIGMLICKMFTTKEAIYISLILISIGRPLVVGCCATYIRIRFHPEHFNKLFGIFTTIVSAMSYVQYPLFKWMYSSPDNFITANWLLMGVLIASLLSPGHMLLRCLSRKYALQRLKYININPK